MSISFGLVRLLGPLKGKLALAMLLSAAALLSGIALTAIAAYLIAKAAIVSDVAALTIAFAAVRGFAIARAGLRYGERYVSHSLALGAMVRMRSAFYAAVEPLAPAALTRFRGGDLLSRVMADVQTLEGFYIRVLLPPVAAAIAVGVVVLAMAVFAVAPAVLVLCLLLVMGAVLPFVVNRRQREPSRQLIEQRGELQSAMVDEIRGAADLQLSDADAGPGSRTEQPASAVERAQACLAYVRAQNAAAAVIVSSLAALGVLWFAVTAVRSGELDGVYLGMLVLLTVASFEAVHGMPAVLQQLEASNTAGRRVFELIDRPSPRNGQVTALKRDASIEFGRVSFRYGAGSRLVLQDFSLLIPAGKKVALVGPSGCGKTTLVNLLLRFWTPQSGRITLGDVDLEQYDAEFLRSVLSVVSQDVHLFNGTIADNLRIADPDAGNARLKAACTSAMLGDLIASKPAGLDTVIGESGLLLSGGERQRLAIARMLLKDAPLFILDEPTANLDVETERLLVESLRVELAGKTGLLITHRPAVCDLADEVVEMSGGCIVRRSTRAT